MSSILKQGLRSGNNQVAKVIRNTTIDIVLDTSDCEILE